MMNSYRKKREGRSHRHRKRRQENGTDSKSTDIENTGDVETHQALEIGNSIDMVKKSFTPTRSHVDTTQIAYVLYYEQGVPRFDIPTLNSVQSSSDVKSNNVFSSDLGMEEYSRSTKNLTLVNTSGKNTKVVGFRLKNLSE